MKINSKSPFPFLCQLEDYQVHNIHRLIQRFVDTKQNELLEDVATFIGVSWLLELYGGEDLVELFYKWTISSCVKEIQSDISKQRTIMEARKILRDFLKRRNETTQKRLPRALPTPTNNIRPRSKTEMANSQNMPSLKKPEMKNYNILLLGESGAGKTTFINGLYNYCKYPEIPSDGSPILIDCSSLKNPGSTIGRKEDRNRRAPPPTTKSCTYSMAISRDEVLNIIDTPDISYARNQMEIMRFLKESHIKRINAVCLILQPDEFKLTPSLRYHLNTLFSLLPKCAAKNIFFCFSQYSSIPAEILGVIHSHLENLKYERKTVFSFKNAKIFSFDNSCLQYALAAIQNPQLPEIDLNKHLWRRNVLTTKRMIKEITKVAPFPKELMLDCYRFVKDSTLKTKEFFQVLLENMLFEEADRVFLIILLLARIHLYLEANQLVYQGDKFTRQLLLKEDIGALEVFASLVKLHNKFQRKGHFCMTGGEVKAAYKQITIEDYTASCRSEKL